MTFAEKLFNVLASSRKPGEQIPKERWLAIVNEFADAERPLGKDGKARKPKKQLPINRMTDSEFMDYLEAAPALAGIDLQREIGKCQFHFKAKGIIPSRMRLINWLNNADKKLAVHGRDAETRKADATERTVPPPHGWAEWAKNRNADLAAREGEENGVAAFAILNNNFYALPKSWREDCRRDLGR